MMPRPMQECVAECKMVLLLQVTKIYWDFRKGLVPIIGGSRWVWLTL